MSPPLVLLDSAEREWTMKASEDLVAGTFGHVDKKFACHQNDRDRAFEYLTTLRNERKGWSFAKQQLEDYLNGNVEDENHRDEQIKKAERMLEPWLDD